LAGTGEPAKALGASVIVIGMNNDFISLDRTKYGVAISWDRALKEVDLDLQVVVVDSSGAIVDAIYHNNLVAMNGALRHSGDNKAGNSTQYGELVWIDVAKFPMRIKMLIFVVAACSGGHLVDVRKGTISVMRPREKGNDILAQYHMEASNGDVDAVVMMKRKPSNGAWMIGPIDECAEEGESFLDILEVIGKLIKAEIPAAPSQQNVRFVMDKDQSDDLKNKVKTSMHARNRRHVALPGKVYDISLEWDGELQPDCAVDLHAFVVSKGGIVTEIVNSNNLVGYGRAVFVAVNELEVQEPQCRGLGIDLTSLHEQSRLILFVLTVDHDKGLPALGGLSLVVLDEESQKSKARFMIALEGCVGHCKILMWLHKSDDAGWELVQSTEEAHQARHFMEARGTLGSIIREFIPQAPSDDEALFRLKMVPGATVVLPEVPAFRTVTVVVAWGLAPSQSRAPGLSVAAVLFDEKQQQVSVATASQSQETYRAGAQCPVEAGRKSQGDRYSQTFTLNMAGMGKKVEQILFLMTVSGEGGLEALNGVTCTLIGESGAELACFEVGTFLEDPGILLARLRRFEVANPASTPRTPPSSPSGSTGASSSSRQSPNSPPQSPRSPRRGTAPQSARSKSGSSRPWAFQAIGRTFRGRRWNDAKCKKNMRTIVETSLRDLQMPSNEILLEAALGGETKEIERLVCLDRAMVPAEATMPLSSQPYLILASAAASFELLRTQRIGRRPTVRNTLKISRLRSASSKFFSEFESNGDNWA